MTLMLRASTSWIIVAFLRARFRLGDFLVRMWLRNDLLLFSFPLPVFFIRLAADRLVFILGIFYLRSVIFSLSCSRWSGFRFLGSLFRRRLRLRSDALVPGLFFAFGTGRDGR